MTLVKSSILFHFDAGYGRGVYPTVGGFPELTRSGAAFARNVHGTLIRLPASTPRSEPATIRGAVRPVMVLEAARTNELLQSEDFTAADWSSLGTNGVTITADDAVAPDGNVTADLVTPGGATNDRISQQITVADDSLSRAGSVFVRKDPNRTDLLRLILIYTGGTQVSGDIQVDLSDGSIGSSTADESGVEDLGDWWRIWVVQANNGTGNTNLLLQVHPDQTDGDDAAHLWGAQIEEAASFSSYIKTTTSTASRAADNTFRWRGTVSPQAMFIYLDLLWPGSGDGAAQMLFTLEREDGSARVTLHGDSNDFFRSIHDNGTDAAVGASVDPVAGARDEVEGLAILNADGSVRVVVKRPDGTVAGAAATSAPASGLASDYGENIYMNSRAGGTDQGVGRYARALIGKLGDVDTATDGTADEALLEEIRSFCNRITPAGEVR